MRNYFRKMKGGAERPPRVNLFEIVWSWIGAFAGITAVAFVHHRVLDGSDLVMIIGSFGACCRISLSSPDARRSRFARGRW